MERDLNLPHKEKQAAMQTWWEGDFDAFSSCGFTKNCFERMVVDSRILFRHGTLDLLEFTSHHEIPLVVLSAGISELIKASFTMLGAPKSYKVVSNTFKFENGRTTSYYEPLVTPYQKQSAFYNRVAEKRRNLILLGDIIEDRHMACDKKHDNIVRVGFLNHC
jgi:2-hydroxy-3-keto-5-methylthiopentenyl-1-phosphate phosphatase